MYLPKNIFVNKKKLQKLKRHIQKLKLYRGSDFDRWEFDDHEFFSNSESKSALI